MRWPRGTRFGGSPRTVPLEERPQAILRESPRRGCIAQHRILQRGEVVRRPAAPACGLGPQAGSGRRRPSRRPNYLQPVENAIISFS